MVTDRQKLEIFREMQRERMRELGGMRTKAKAAAARANGLRAAEVLRTSRENLVKGAKALASGVSLKRAAREIAHCREKTLREFCERHGMPTRKAKTPPRK